MADTPCLISTNEFSLEAQAPLGALGGRLLLPEASNRSAPLSIIIPGSGPTDLDGNSPLGIKASTYKLLAESLALAGIATLRIDKRGLFSSAAATPDPNAVTIQDYVSDIGAWTSIAQRRTGASSAWLIGHSEGALVAMAAAQRIPAISGLILLCCPGRPVGNVLRDQLTSTYEIRPFLDLALRVIDDIEAGKRVDPAVIPAPLLPLFRPEVQDFLIDLFSYDPTRLLSSITLPVLAIHGEEDLQVSPGDAALLKAANPAVRFVFLKNTNHVLKSVNAADRPANIAAYADPELPLAPGVSDTICDFIEEAGK